MLRNTLLLFLVIASPSWVEAQTPGEIIKDDYVFTLEHSVLCTDVENQANTGTCWSFSTGSFLESEAMKAGKNPVNLSEMFWVRGAYLEKAEKYLRYHGKSNFGQGGLSHDVLRLYDRFGAMPESAYNGKVDSKKRHNHNKLEKDLRAYLDSLIASKTIDVAWKMHFKDILDLHLGACPDTFTYAGKTYDPQTFAEQFVGINVNDYLTVTSFSHHPAYSKFVLEVPDNFSDGTYLNLPLSELRSVLRRAVADGHSIVWDCDVSESGFSARQGLAIVPVTNQEQAAINPFRMPHQEQKITAEMRQMEFDSYSLTDDHLMHIVGIAEDQSGETYYYVKNSWGKEPGFEGFLLASESYVLLNTIGLTVHKDALGRELWSKISAHQNASD